MKITTLGMATLALALAGCGSDSPGNPFDSGTASATGTGGSSTTSASSLDSTGPGGSGSGDAGATSSSEEGATGIKLDVGVPETTGPFENEGCESIDVLFVVDISASMTQEKDNLDANFPQFVQVMDDYIADPGNSAMGYRLGVTNSTIVNNGIDQSTMGLDGELFAGKPTDCGTGGTPWLEGPAPGITANFSCLAPNPQSDCLACTDFGHERPLDAIEAFIDKSAPGGVNEGFYQGDNALLVIVLLTDEDDDAAYSTTDPPVTKAALDEFASGEERYVIVTISGPSMGSCNSAFGSASAAPRLHELTGLVPNGLQGDICQGDLAASLADALELIQSSCDSLPPPVG